MLGEGVGWFVWPQNVHDTRWEGENKRCKHDTKVHHDGAGASQLHFLSKEKCLKCCCNAHLPSYVCEVHDLTS